MGVWFACSESTGILVVNRVKRSVIRYVNRFVGRQNNKKKKTNKCLVEFSNACDVFAFWTGLVQIASRTARRIRS